MMKNIKSKVISFIDAKTQEQINFVTELCNLNSYSYNKIGTDKVGTMLLQQLEQKTSAQPPTSAQGSSRFYRPESLRSAFW